MAIARRLSPSEAAALAEPFAALGGWTSAANALRQALAGAKLLAVLRSLGVPATPRSVGRALGGLAAAPPDGFVVSARVLEGELLYHVAEGTAPPVVVPLGEPLSGEQAQRWTEYQET